MKSLITLTAVLAAMLSVSAAADALPLDASVKPAVTRLANPAPKTGLYVGNSFTYYNCGLVGYVRGFAKAAGIPVCNIPTYGTTAVAQFAMALLLELCHHVADHSRSVKAGDWSRCPDFCYWNTPLIELAGKTFGVIGYGRIGQATARLAAAFGMEVLACDAYAKPCPPARLTTLEEVLEKSDVISLHCPLTPETQGIINRETLDRMKDGVFLLNTSRGPLVDEAALADALASGKVAGAGLDVLAVEPPLADNPLMARPNCLITPHIAWAPKESRQRLMDVAVANLKAWLNGAPQNVVNP